MWRYDADVITHCSFSIFTQSVMWRFIIGVVIEALAYPAFGEKYFSHLTSIALVARSWGTWCSQLAGTWRIHKGEEHCEDRTWEIWDRYMVFFPFSTRVQWLPEAVFLWILPQLHEAQRTASEAHGELYLFVPCLFVRYMLLPWDQNLFTLLSSFHVCLNCRC